MTVNPDTLNTSLQALAGVFDDITADLGLTLTACVTPVEPAVDCDTIHIWPQTVNSLRLDRCMIAPEVVVNWRVTVCIGSDKLENCEWWDTHTPTVLERAWGYYGGLVLAYMDGTLCDALSTTCQDTRLDPVNPVPSADYVAYQGAIRYVLGVVEATS